MRKSKLETYEDILEALLLGPQTVDALAYRMTIHCAIVTQRLDFLIQQGLVAERPSDEETAYAITERGAAVLKALNFEKYLKRVANTIKTVDDAYQILPMMSKDEDQRER